VEGGAEEVFSSVSVSVSVSVSDAEKDGV